MTTEKFEDPNECCVNDLGLEKYELMVIIATLKRMEISLLEDLTNGKEVPMKLHTGSIVLCSEIRMKIEEFIRAREKNI